MQSAVNDNVVNGHGFLGRPSTELRASGPLKNEVVVSTVEPADNERIANGCGLGSAIAEVVSQAKWSTWWLCPSNLIPTMTGPI